MRLQRIGVAVALAFGLCALASAQQMGATATLKPTTGNTAEGTVTFAQKGDKVSVTANLSGRITRSAWISHPRKRGLQLRRWNGAPAAISNPTGKPHGDPTTPDHHTGDMPQLVADAGGKATLTADLNPMTIGASANDIIGKAVIVHKDPDDFKTQPTGNSGARVACGVIAKS